VLRILPPTQQNRGGTRHTAAVRHAGEAVLGCASAPFPNRRLLHDIRTTVHRIGAHTIDRRWQGDSVAVHSDPAAAIVLRRAITGAPRSRPPIEPSHSTNGSPPTSSWPDWCPNSPACGESRRRLSSPSRALGVVSSVAMRRREREEKARLHSFIAARGLFREVVVSLRPISPHDGYGDVRFVRAIMEEGG
jgi:hypothetical protein